MKALTTIFFIIAIHVIVKNGIPATEHQTLFQMTFTYMKNFPHTL